ncbi:MAG: tellurite resistance TerB family protein [Pirellula sp.]|nr:tellurite resistance TerB family protein [Pirellula sp.]
MNAIDILGSLLGAGQPGAKGGGGAADILAEILGGAAKASAPQGNPRPSDAHTSAKQLEEMLGVGRESASASSRGTQYQAPSSSIPTDIFGQRKVQEPKINLSVPKPAPLSQNDQAVLFIRAMINSAKVDGEISDEEQKSILGQIGDTSPETIKFLRAEFARPLNVVEYAQSLPVGMELKAYAISLTAISVDTKEEADYLRQLAKALRITPEQCNQIHQQQNAPLMYQA